MGNIYVIIAWDQAPKWGQWNERESLGKDEDNLAPPPFPLSSPPPRLASLTDFLPFLSRFLLFPPITEPGPRLLL